MTSGWKSRPGEDRSHRVATATAGKVTELPKLAGHKVTKVTCKSTGRNMSERQADLENLNVEADLTSLQGRLTRTREYERRSAGAIHRGIRRRHADKAVHDTTGTPSRREIVGSTLVRGTRAAEEDGGARSTVGSVGKSKAGVREGALVSGSDRSDEERRGDWP